jgi:hypothetical protein
MSREDEFVHQMAEVRQTTRNLIESVMMDVWPRNAAIIDFGLDSQQHYEALYYPIREMEIMPKALDEALGHGEKLTALVRESEGNPHKDIEFSTSWDAILGRKTPDGALSEETKLERTMERLANPDPFLPEIRELAAEIGHDEQAARVRNYGSEDAATYEQRVKGGTEIPITEWQSEFGRMIEVVAKPSSAFEEALKEAASRGSNQDKGKDGPER